MRDAMMTYKPEDNFSKPFVIAIKTIIILFALSMIAIMVTHENFLDTDKQLWVDYSTYTLLNMMKYLFIPVMIITLRIHYYEIDESRKYKGITNLEFVGVAFLSVCLVSMAIGFKYSSNTKNQITMEQFLKGEPTFINRKTITEDSHE